MYRLLNVGGNAKTVKGDKTTEYTTAILYLAPANMAGTGLNLCPKATEGCKESCLYNSGRAIAYGAVNQARIRRTKQFVENREWFLNDLGVDLDRFARVCKKNDRKPAVRLNGTSDIMWERIQFKRNGITYMNVMAAYPEIQFYDYTKIPNRNNLPSNYTVAFSLADGNDHEAVKAIENGLNVAVVFRNKNLPEKFWGMPVFGGDDTDLRFLDPKGVIIGLKAKGKARYDQSGFVKEVDVEYQMPVKCEDSKSRKAKHERYA